MPVYDICGCSVDFPFEAYPVQLVYMEKVVLALEHGSNALLESPTGTGKTLCLLCAALGWRRAQVERQRAASASAPGGVVFRGESAAALAARFGGGVTGAADGGSGRAPRIIYASRTHSQLQQVVRELRRTAHRPLVCMLGSREQLCCHNDVSKLTGPTQTAACQALTAAQSCVYHRKLQDHKRKHGSVPHPQAGLDEVIRPVPDIEDFVSSSKREELCPFYYARELQATSDVLFLPYNYLLDPKARKALNINLASDVLIFDEAHNIERVCADAASFNLSSLDLAGAIRELDRLLAGAKNVGADEAVEAEEADDVALGGAGSRAASSEELVRARQVVLTVDAGLGKVPLQATKAEARYVAAGESLAALLGTAGIDQQTAEPLIELCERCVATLGEAARFGVTTGSSFNLQKIADALKIAFDQERPPSEYRVCITELPERGERGGGGGGFGGGAANKTGVLDTAPKPRTLGYWCFHSGAAMRALLAAGVRSVLLTSGTLSPLGSFADELGLPFEHRLENPHVIEPQAQLFIGTFVKGPSGHELTSSYKQRESDACKLDLGNAIVNFSRIVPQGVLVFFPSYAAMQSAHAAWLRSPGGGAADGAPSVLERIKRNKTLIVEPRDAAECAAAIESFKAAVQSSVFRGTGGAMLFAVCRGKLSEGVDFADAACRGVVITGLPLPPAFDAKVSDSNVPLSLSRSQL